MFEDGDERPLFLPPTDRAPRYGVGAPPAPRAAAPAAPRLPPRPSGPPPAPGRNYSVADPGAPRGISTQLPVAVVAEPSNPLAVTSLSFGIVGLFFLITFAGILVVNLPCSVVAWIVGVHAQRRPGQQSMAQAGRITGIVGTVLGALAVVLWGLVALAAN